MLEELLALGHSGAEYDAWLIRITEGDQFGSGFVAVNPNSEIPALSGPCSFPSPPIRVFEFGRNFCCTWLSSRSSARSCPPLRRLGAECLSRLFWNMGSAPILSGWWIWPLLRLRAVEDRIRHRSLCDGGEARTRCARSDGWPSLSIWQAPTTRSPIWPSGLGMAPWRWAGYTRRANSYKSRIM